MGDWLNVYVDNSNIFHEGQRFAEKMAKEDRYGFRIHFENFLKLLIRKRRVRDLVWGGSTPPPQDTVWKYLREELNVNTDLIPRSESGENETVDNAIQLRMHRHVRKYRDAPGLIVLCTGDGKGYFNEEGFLYDVEGFVEDGWELELVSWSHCCHTKLKRFAEEHGVFLPLERFYSSISFQKGGRQAMTITPDEVEDFLVGIG